MGRCRIPTREVFAQFRTSDRAGSDPHAESGPAPGAGGLSRRPPRPPAPEAYAGLWPGKRAGVRAARRRSVWQGRFELMLIGPQEERWDHCFIAEYPSVAAFVEMIRDPVLSGGGEASAGRGRRIASDPPCGVPGRKNVWRNSDLNSSPFGYGAAPPGAAMSCQPRPGSAPAPPAPACTYKSGG